MWAKIKQEWPLLMGADTLLSVQSMLRLLLWIVVVLRTSMTRPVAAHTWSSKPAEVAPVAGACAALLLSAAMARAALAHQTTAYGLDGPLGGLVPAFCEVSSVAWLAAITARASDSMSASAVGASLALAAWLAVHNHLNLSGRDTGGDFRNDKLFILANCLEVLASLAFLARTVRSTCEANKDDKPKSRSVWDGFIHLLLPAQQALSAYYFLTAFDPDRRLVGAGRPFCILILGNLAALAAFLCAFAFYIAGCLLSSGSAGAAQNGSGMETLQDQAAAEDQAAALPEVLLTV